MKDGLLFTQLPFIDSPSLKDAVDNAPDLSGVDLNAPLLSSISTTAADISRDSVETFATSPSLFKAILRYILHYEFDVSEFLELLDTLEEIRIPKFRKEDNVDLISSATTLRDFDITSLSVGSPPETRAATDASDISTQLGNGSINELIATIVADPLVDKVPNRSLSERVDVLLDIPRFKRDTDIGEDLFFIPPVNLATGQGEFFSLAQTKSREDEFFAESKQPLVLVGDIFTSRDAVDLISSQTFGYQPTNEFEVGLAGSGYDADGFLYCDPRILPGYREFIHAASRAHAVAKTTPTGAIADTLYMLPDEVRKKFALDVKLRGLPEELEPITDRQTNDLEYQFLVEQQVFKQANSSAFDSIFSKESAPTVVKAIGPFKESLFSISEKFGFDIRNRLRVAAATESFPRKKVSSLEEDLLNLSQSLNFKGKFFTPPTQKFKIQEDERKNKIVLDFLIEKTFWSIHSDLSGFIVSGGFGDYVWVDLGDEYDKIIYHPSITLDADGNPIDEDGNIYEPVRDGWPSSTPFYQRNERYIQTSARSNMGRFRQGRESALYPEYRDRYGSAVAELLGKQEVVPGLDPIVWRDTDDSINRFGEKTLAASDVPRIQGEGGEFLTIFFRGLGYGYNGSYGPAPRKWTYDYHGAFGPNRQKRWAKRDGPFYLSYIHRTTHQDSGRRINLLLREMTTEDENTSNLYGGKRQIMTGPTFIDRMLQTEYWNKMFKMIEGIVQIQGNPTTEDSISSKDRLNNIGLGPTNYIPTEKLEIGFRHRYESELMAEPLYDIDLKYTYHLHDEKAGADGNRYWPYNVAPYFRTQPANWDAKVRLKTTTDVEDDSFAKSLKPFIFNGAASFLRDKTLAQDLKDKNKVGKRVSYRVTRTPLLGEDEDGDPIYGPPVTTNDDETVHIIPATFQPIYDPRYDDIIIGYTFIKGEAFQIKQKNSVFDAAAAKMLRAIIAKTPKDSISDRINAVGNDLTHKIIPEIEQQVGVQLDQGYYEERLVPRPGSGLPPLLELVFIPKPELAQKNSLVNEVAAADSGTAFVPVYCLPSYFMETYVGEDGKHANF